MEGWIIDWKRDPRVILRPRGRQADRPVMDSDERERSVPKRGVNAVPYELVVDGLNGWMDVGRE